MSTQRASTGCLGWICMKLCVPIQLRLLVSIPCHNHCASLLWVKPLWDLPAPHIQNKPCAKEHGALELCHGRPCQNVSSQVFGFLWHFSHAKPCLSNPFHCHLHWILASSCLFVSKEHTFDYWMNNSLQLNKKVSINGMQFHRLQTLWILHKHCLSWEVL